MQPHKLTWAKEWLKSPKKNYINGQWIEGSGKKWNAVNPATQDTLCSYSTASANDVEEAAKSAQACFQKGEWRKMNAREKGAHMKAIGQLVRDHAAELATIEALSNGKLYSEALFDDMPDSGDVFDYYAGWIDKYQGETLPVPNGFLNYTLKEPVGVCGLIVPWNYPLLLACWKIAPALAMGNTVIVKPSEHTSLSLIRLFELIHEKLKLPAGLLNLVIGAAETGDALTKSKLVNKISFTGSTRIGRQILHNSADSNLKPVTLELGGKSPCIFFDDTADLQAAIDRGFTAMFSQKGEKCSEPTRFIIHDKIYDKFLASLISKAEAVKCGDPFSASFQQGSQCHEAHFNSIMKYIEIGKEEGAKLVAGGTRDTSKGNEKGFFIRPTIFSEVDNKTRIAQEEIFGPVLVCTRFKTEEESVAIANDSAYGLAAGLYTSNVNRAHRVSQQLDAGMVFVNKYGCYDFSSPFGGFKQSGWGKEMAIHSLESYTKTKSIWLNLQD